MKKSSVVKRILKRIAIIAASVCLAVVITAGVILHGRISNMMSVKQIGEQLYTVNYKQNYRLDKALASEIESEEDLLDFICDEMFFGHQVEGNLEKYSCSAFITQSPDGKYLVGRNFGLGGSDTLCLYTHPNDGYASISSVSTDMIDVGVKSETAVTSLFGRASLLASPYMGVDGVNEKGLTAALLDLEEPETHMDTGKPDLTVTMVIRLLLDWASTVDEAVELLSQHDIHTAHGCTQHIYIADANGDAAIVEWHREEMKVVNNPICTNFRMSAKALNGNFSGVCDRYDVLDKALKEKPENTVEDSMKMLEAVKQEYQEYGIFTEWSVVFNLTDFTAYYAVNMNYDRVYHLNPKVF